MTPPDANQPAFTILKRPWPWVGQVGAMGAGAVTIRTLSPMIASAKGTSMAALPRLAPVTRTALPAIVITSSWIVPAEGHLPGTAGSGAAAPGWASRGVQRALQPGQPAVPVLGQRREVGLGNRHRCRVDAEADPASLARLGEYEARGGEQLQVLGDRLPRDRQRACQVGRRRRAAGREGTEDAAPGRLGQRGEDRLRDCLRVRPRHGDSRPARPAPCASPRHCRDRRCRAARRAPARTRTPPRSAVSRGRSARG